MSNRYSDLVEAYQDTLNTYRWFLNDKRTPRDALYFNNLNKIRAELQKILKAIKDLEAQGIQK